MQWRRVGGAVLLSAYVLAAQTPPAKPPAGRAIGEVTSVDAAAGQIALKSDKGDPIQVTLGEKTLFLRVPPGEKDLTKASRIRLSDIAVGDRVLARGQVSEDQKSVTASAVIVMSKAELAQMHQRKREEWQQRGVAGAVVSVDASKRMVINVRSREGLKPMTVEPGSNTEYWRYAPDSVKFTDAKPSSFAEIRPGDQVRVLGEKAPDNSSIKAEQVVSGTFKQIGATVVSVNPGAGEIRVTDLLTKKPVLIKVNGDTSVKKMPPMMATMMAHRLNPSGSAQAAGTPPAGGAGERAAGGSPQGGPPGGGMRRGSGPPDIQQMLERIPDFNIAELKPGDALIVSSTAGADPSRVTAIMVMAGVEPLLSQAPERAVNFGGWNFGEIGAPE